MADELYVQLSVEGVDEEGLASLTNHLRNELLQLDVDDVRAALRGPPPASTRSVDAAAVGALVVTFGRSAEALRSIVSTIWRWLERDKPADRKIRLEIDGATLELTQATAADQERLVEMFVDRHAQSGERS